MHGPQNINCVLHRGWYISILHYCYSYHYYMSINLVHYVQYMNLHDIASRNSSRH
jgi:hypothetical protein